MYKKIIAVAVCLVCVVGMCAFASADTSAFNYGRLLNYGEKYIDSFHDGDLATVDVTYTFDLTSSANQRVWNVSKGIGPFWSNFHKPDFSSLLTLTSGSRVTFKFTVFSGKGFSDLKYCTFVIFWMQQGTQVRNAVALDYSQAEKFSFDVILTFTNNTTFSWDLKSFGFEVSTHAGSFGFENFGFHIWSSAEITNQEQVDAINKQTDKITGGWVQGDVTPPAGSDKVDDFGSQESALLDGQADGLAAGKQSFADTLTSIQQYQGAFLAVSKMIMDFVTMSPAFSFIFYTSLSLGLCCFVLCLGQMIARSTHERAGKGKGG